MELYEAQLRGMGFTDEQVSVMVSAYKDVVTTNEMSSKLNVSDIINEIKKVNINEADEDEADTEDDISDVEVDDTEADTEDDISDVEVDDTEADTEVDAESDIESDTEADTEEFEDDSDLEMDNSEDVEDESEMESDEESDESDMEGSIEDDMEDETEGELEDDVAQDEDEEVDIDYDALSSDDLEYKKAYIQALQDRSWASGYAMGYNDNGSLKAIGENKQLISNLKLKLNESNEKPKTYKQLMDENKQLLESMNKKNNKTIEQLKEEKKQILNKTKIQEKVEPKVTPKVKKTEKPKVTPKVEKTEKKQILEQILGENPTKKVVQVKENAELNKKAQIMAELYNDIEVPPTYSRSANTHELLEEQVQIENDKKEFLIEQYLGSLNELKRAEVSTFVIEMAKGKSYKEVKDLLSIMPVSIGNVEQKNYSKKDEIFENKKVNTMDSVSQFINNETLRWFN